MSSVNTNSVREEIERLKSDFGRLSADKKINKEAMLLFHSMLAIINLLIAVFLEKTTKKNNKNSSVPSSQTEKDESSLTTKGSKGKGKNESDETAENTRTVETVTVSEAAYCDVCGEDLKDIDCEDFERRTKIDIVFEKVVEHVDAEIKHCPC